MKKISTILSALIMIIFCFGISSCGKGDTDENTSLKATTLGIGGGGRLFNPTISPFDENTMVVIPDMGGIYISNNTGVDWTRTNLQGLVQKAYFDPNREGVLYAGGVGLYRSTDNGKNFKIIFPKEEEIIERRNCDETTMQYLFTTTDYPTYKLVKDILVNPNDSNNIFVLMYYGAEGTVFESKDNGKSFSEIFTYTKKKSYGIWDSFDKLLYQKESDTLYYSIEEGVFMFDRDFKECKQVYKSETEIVDIDYFQENEKTYFTFIEKDNQLEKFETKVFYTTDFIIDNMIDISSKIITGLQDTFDANGYVGVTYKWKFEYIVANSLSNIYITQN